MLSELRRHFPDNPESLEFRNVFPDTAAAEARVDYECKYFCKTRRAFPGNYRYCIESYIVIRRGLCVFVAVAGAGAKGRALHPHICGCESRAIHTRIGALVPSIIDKYVPVPLHIHTFCVRSKCSGLKLEDVFLPFARASLEMLPEGFFLFPRSLF